MDAGAPSRKSRPTKSPSHGQGRELEDDELFGHLFLLPSPRSKQRLQRQNRAPQASRKQLLKKRPRSSSFVENPRYQRRESLDIGSCTRTKQTLEKKTSRVVDADSINISQKDFVQKEQLKTTLDVDENRCECSPSPRTYDEIVGRFAPMGDTSKIYGVPRLSTLALGVARTYAARGKLLDLSDLADSYVHEILEHKDLGAPVLIKLERLNPSRINVLEASWARLVLNEFGERELPTGVHWWRTLYEMKMKENLISLERARARLKQRYDAADADKSKRHMETTRFLGVGKRKAKSPSNSSSRIAKLRMDMKRERRKW